ncbi:MAG: gliding motility lipoprotein GldH [Bacteroidales bacterium]|nr:gliding motility lipoprotein GldH [Bacteroidales bacterium]
MRTLGTHLALICLVAAVASCRSDVFYSEYAAVDQHGWRPEDSVCFNVDVDDTVQVYNFLVDIRNHITYPYSNAFLFIGTTFPDGSVARDTMELPLADPTGEWYGKRTGRYVESRYYFRRNARFPMQGTYRFAVTNGLRDSAIVGLSDIGLRIEYSKTY